ncbi:DNA-directed RNA polymerase III subunit RPC2, variant 3 [Bonamia ostreae]|uniref:DNA-directed RNA polymerase subunit beta n=1 Tax=Bonamia ostreae TaxID=126728 RepID=A0ABV2AF25_9EUKA
MILKLQKKTRGQEFDAVKFLKMRRDIITKGFVHTISTGNWTLHRFNMDRHGVTAVLNRLSYISTIGHMTRISSSVEKNRKISGPRALQASQWGMICPSDTPEGEGCGLIKNLALLAHVTTEEDDQILISIAFALGAEDIKNCSRDFYTDKNAFVVFVNGRAIGIHFDYQKFVNSFKLLRRKGLIHRFVSVYHHEDHRCLYIASDEGRVCRPLIIVDNGQPLVTKKHLIELEDGLSTFEDFVLNGLIEYLDVNEENNAFVALNESHLSRSTTHLEIDEMVILGFVSGLIPFPHHNQSPRNTYQCAMGKQSMGAIGLNQHLRLDTLLYNLVSLQKPLVKTKTLDFINFDKLPAGQNAIVAVMSYSGYDIEDAIILNKGSVERGFGKCVVYRKHTTSISRYVNNTFDKISKDKTERNSTGLCEVDSKLNPRDIIVNKFSPKNTLVVSENTSYRHNPLVYREREPAIVDKVMATSNTNDHFLLKILTRETRSPEIGDKFSSRHGQKGVCGLIVPQCDLPFNQDGVTPDIIMNPHGFPSRMTIGKLVEIIAGKVAVLEGKLKYGTAFGNEQISDTCEALLKHGYNYSGKELLYSGITGEALESFIFMGPVYYQKLKHMVADKMHARARGPKTTLVRQPREGRSKEGGLRLGEMERDCLIAYGTSMLLQERLCFSSDKYTVLVCRDCGMMVYKEWCNLCKKKTDMAMLTIPYACKLLFQELISMNIVTKIRLRNE